MLLRAVVKRKANFMNSLFLYFVLLTGFAGVVYFFYTVWIAPYFPQKRKPGKTDFSKKSSGTSKKDEAAPVETAASPVSSATRRSKEIFQETGLPAMGLYLLAL